MAGEVNDARYARNDRTDRAIQQHGRPAGILFRAARRRCSVRDAHARRGRPDARDLAQNGWRRGGRRRSAAPDRCGLHLLLLYGKHDREGMGLGTRSADAVRQEGPKGVTSANCALRDALTVLGAKRVALVTPYPEDLNALLPAFFSAGGFEVSNVTGTPIRDVAAVRGLSPDQIFRSAGSVDATGTYGVCL